MFLHLDGYYLRLSLLIYFSPSGCRFFRPL